MRKRNHSNVKCVTAPVLHRVTWRNVLKQFLRKRNLSNVKSVTNISLKHYMKEPVESIHEGNKPFKCEICDSTCSTDLNPRIWNSMLQRFMIKKIPFKCEICDYTFARKGHVKKHVESFQEKKKSFKNVKFVDTAVLLNLTLTGISKQFMILWYVWSPPGIRA